MLTPYQPTSKQPWNVERVVHLHRRAGFGPTWTEIQRDLKEGPQAAVDRLLLANQGPAPSDAADEFERMSAVIGDAAAASENINRLKAWWLYRMLFTPDPLGERLTLMWHNHFATSNLKVADVSLMRRQNAVFRRYARASFTETLPRVIKDPAMLMWLDADANRKEHPNENLARELMELFTLGVGNYSEDDVKAAARALTGWTVRNGDFHLADQRHDHGRKTIFGKAGAFTGDDLVRMLLEHPATGRRLAFRVLELLMGEGRLVGDLVDELAEGLRDHNLDIGWAVETVLRSEAFFAGGNIGSRVREPVELVISAARSLEISDPPPSTLLLAETTAKLGQDLFNPPNVFGWPGGRSWLTSRALIGRANFAAALVEGKLRMPSKPLDAAALAESHGFMKADEIGAFFSQLLLGRLELPAEFQRYVEAPNRLVAALLASPQAQLA